MNEEIKQLIEEYTIDDFERMTITNINELIEIEAIKYDRSIGNWVGREASFIVGGRFVLSKWQEENRWRKVEDELPECGFKNHVIARQNVGDTFMYSIGYYAVGEWIFGFDFRPEEWKPIT